MSDFLFNNYLMHNTFEFNLLDFQTNNQKMDANNAWDLAWRFLLVWLLLQ